MSFSILYCKKVISSCFVGFTVQFNSQSSSVPSHAGIGLGVQATGLNAMTSPSLQQQPNSILSQSLKDAGLLFYYWNMFTQFGRNLGRKIMCFCMSFIILINWVASLLAIFKYTV